MSLIEVDQDRVRMTVNDYNISDIDIVSFFSEVPANELDSRLSTVIRIGTMGLRAIGTSERVDYIEKRFNSLKEAFDKRLELVFGDHGQLQNFLDDFLGENGQVLKTLRQEFGENGSVMKNVFDPNIKGTPLAIMKEAFEDGIKEMRKDLNLSAGEANIKQKTPLKGYDFEDYVEDTLSSIARSYGDIIERTTDSPGLIERSKKGDFVSSIGERSNLKFVFEAKDVQSMSFHQIESEIEEALLNRGADYGVFVARQIGMLPKSMGWFNEYNGNHIVVALSNDNDEEFSSEILNIAYRWARIRALTGKQTPAAGFDVTAIGDKVKSFSQIKTYCTNVRSAIENIEGESERIRKEISAALATITEEIART